jgi:uncharacterized protein YcbK (DUF882 family)
MFSPLLFAAYIPLIGISQKNFSFILKKKQIKLNLCFMGIFNTLLSLVKKKAPVAVVPVIVKPKIISTEGQITEHFTWHEALWLPQWKRLANESDGLTEEIKQNLIGVFTKMVLIRDLVGKPINIHCAFRPTAYNLLVGGAKSSQHLTGKAVDFSVKGMSCDDVRELLKKHYQEYKIRLEWLPKSLWVHIDIKGIGVFNA